MHIATHLTKSRHGIWYYRWVVPAHIRASNPSLPKELKRSTRTADIRIARARARKLHMTLAQPYMNIDDLDGLLEDARRHQYRVAVDPATGRVELEAEPHETEAALAAVRQLQDMMRNRIHQTVAELRAKSSEPVAPTSVPLISVAFAKYATEQIELNHWSENTRQFTHEPSVTLFRELIGEPTATADGETQLDLTLSSLSREMMSGFIETFRRFPERQGKRYANAREALAQGGERQSIDNYFKRLEHIHQFIRYCIGKGWVLEEVGDELKNTLKRNNARSKQASTKRRVAEGGSASDGYVSFSKAELQSIFGPGFEPHVAFHKGDVWRPAEIGRATYRYWSPLIALYSGLRVGEIGQLQVKDFEVREGVECITVAEGRAATEDGDVTRLKTLASARTIPLHPKLLELGLLEYVEARRATGNSWLWDGLLWTTKDGFGKYLSRDFTLLTKSVGVYERRRKVFHSFRSTIQQALLRAPLDGTLIDQFIGHEVASERHKSYMRTDDGKAFPYEYVRDALAKVAFDIAPPRLTQLLYRP
jgi:integrase